MNTSSAALSNFRSSEEPKIGEDCTEASRIDDLLLEQINAKDARISALEREIKTLQENQDILFDLFSKIRDKTDLQPKQKDNRQILVALLQSHQGKMPEKEARQTMHLSAQAFTNLLAALKDEIEVRKFRTDKRRKLLVLK